MEVASHHLMNHSEAVRSLEWVENLPGLVAKEIHFRFGMLVLELSQKWAKFLDGGQIVGKLDEELELAGAKEIEIHFLFGRLGLEL